MILAYLQDDPLATLETLRDYVAAVCAIQLSAATICRWLDGQLITVKLVRDVPAERNSQPTKERRHYAQWLMETNGFGSCVYIDECGYNVWRRRNYGRSQKGTRCFRLGHGQRGQNISLCLVVGVPGVSLICAKQVAFCL